MVTKPSCGLDLSYSSLISIILVITAIPDTITSVYTPDPVKQQEKQQNTEQQHNHDEHI